MYIESLDFYFLVPRTTLLTLDRRGSTVVGPELLCPVKCSHSLSLVVHGDVLGGCLGAPAVCNLWLTL